MTDNRPRFCGGRVTNVPPKDVTVTDATHSRLRNPMCRCTEEQHGTFPMNTLHEHFSKFKHKSVNSCLYCHSNEVYEFFFTMDRLKMKTYHNCSPQRASNTADSVQKQGQSDTEPISQNTETSDSESSGIGTGYSSLVSIFNGQSDDGQNTNRSLRKSSPSLSDSTSTHNDAGKTAQGRRS